VVILANPEETTSKANYKLLTNNYKLLTNNYELETNNYELETNNYELETSKELITPQAAPSKEIVKPVKKSTRLQEDWEPTQEYWDAAVLICNELNIDLRPRLKQIAHKFKDYWIAKSGKDATKQNWLATWRNWIRREAENAKSGIGSTGKKSYGEQRAELFDGLTDYSKATNF
jgi:hypothetical protein